jgi:hypothetical protein
MAAAEARFSPLSSRRATAQCETSIVTSYKPLLCRNVTSAHNTRRWYVDETYVKVKGKWSYLYRAIDREGNLVDSMLSATRDSHERQSEHIRESQIHNRRSLAGDCAARDDGCWGSSSPCTPS